MSDVSDVHCGLEFDIDRLIEVDANLLDAQRELQDIRTEKNESGKRISKLAGDEKHNADLDGVNLIPLLRTPNAKLKRQALYWHYPHYYPTTSPVSSIRRGDWKLLEYFEDKRIELYDLGRDIGERNNLAQDMPEKAEQLRNELHAWRKAVDAQMPVVNPNRKPGTR